MSAYKNIQPVMLAALNALVRVILASFDSTGHYPLQWE